MVPANLCDLVASRQKLMNFGGERERNVRFASVVGFREALDRGAAIQMCFLKLSVRLPARILIMLSFSHARFS
jgi:hypothetical protein